MKQNKHKDTHYFDIGIYQFSCMYDDEFKSKGYWYVNGDSCDEYAYGFDLNKGFRTVEACEDYIRLCVKKKCKQLLKGLGGKTINIRGGYGDKS